MWANAHRDGCPAEYRWRPLRKFVIPFLVRCRKVWLTSAVGVSCSNTANIGECTFRRRVKFAHGKILSGQDPQKCIYSVPAQETAKRRAKFAWPPVRNIAAVTKTRRESC